MSLLCVWLQLHVYSAVVAGSLRGGVGLLDHLVSGCLSIADIGTLSKSKSGHKGLSKHSQSIMDLCSRSSIAPLPSASRPGLLAITTIVPISARWIDVNDGS